jgi:hypothetical protein
MTEIDQLVAFLAPGAAHRATTMKAGGLTGDEFAGDVTGKELSDHLAPRLLDELRRIMEPTAGAPKSKPGAAVTTKETARIGTTIRTPNGGITYKG